MTYYEDDILDASIEEIMLRKAVKVLQEECTRYPGLSIEIRTGVKCRRVRPEPPHVHNIHMVECHHLLNHEGDHSWGAWPAGER